jgi:NADH:ubiquinone oxidoreductase subunit 2 (subunit N)
MDKFLFIPVVAALVSSLIAAYYYLRVIKTFWFEEDIAVKTPALLLSGDQRVLLSVLEASLWVAAVFAPWILPALTDVIATLVVCADTSTLPGAFSVAPVLSCLGVIDDSGP